MTKVLSLPPDPQQVRVARDFCVRELSTVLAPHDDADELIDDAVMITSELVTNSIRAGATSIALQLEHDQNIVRISVIDDARGEVVPARPQPPETNGRGLLIVASLAEQWGVENVPDGKLVWADLGLPVFGAVPAS